MKKKVVIFMSILSIFAGLTGCGKSKEPVESNKESEVVSESVVQESEQTEEATEAAPEVEHRTGDTIVGVSDKDISELHPVLWKSVVNDVTGKWRYATISNDVNIQDYVLSF